MVFRTKEVIGPLFHAEPTTQGLSVSYREQESKRLKIWTLEAGKPQSES